MPHRLLPLLVLAACAPNDAAVVARGGAEPLACPIYRIDTGRVVSKYIGETEKNLRAAFAAGEASASVLTFDEADALFGKRGEVRDSHDRYANIEVSYLLAEGGEKLKDFSGRAVISGFSRKAPKDGVIVLERKDGVALLEFKGTGRTRALALARDFQRACG